MTMTNEYAEALRKAARTCENGASDYLETEARLVDFVESTWRPTLLDRFIGWMMRR